MLLWDCTPGAGTLQARLAATAPAASREPLQREDLIGIGYTSGTSGAPKLLAIRHASYLHSLRLLLLYLSDPPRVRSRMLVGVPLSGAGSGAVLPAVLSGGQLILPPRYDADALLEALRERRPSHLFTTPSLLIDLPLKYMHTTVELVDMNALRDCARLVATFAAGIDEGWDDALWI